MAQEITNTEDIIDSRDVIARIEELTDDEDRTADECDELTALEALAKEAEDYAEDWVHGEALIRDSYFTEYARQLAEDCCEMPSADQWPHRCIDWGQAASELQMDRT